MQLEEWLGVSLLLRSTRSVVPTEAGRTFYEHAKRTVEEADEAVLAARGSASGLSGKLRVSTSDCFGRLHVIPNLSAFLAEHPDHEIELVLDDRQLDLVNEGIDVSLRMGARNFSPELRSGQVVAILQDWALPPTHLSAVYPTGRLASAKARAFTSFVERFMGGLSSVSPQRERVFTEAEGHSAGLPSGPWHVERVPVPTRVG